MRPKHFPKGLDDRQRDQDGEIRKKRSDTRVDTLRKEYGPNFAKGYRGNVQLGTVLKREGVESLDQLLKRKIRSHTADSSAALEPELRRRTA